MKPNPYMAQRFFTCGANMGTVLDRETALEIELGAADMHIARLTQTVQRSLARCWELREALIEQGYESMFNKFGELVMWPAGIDDKGRA